MSTQVILLERVESLGEMGEVVNVKPGYARNYLLPQRKALRASKDNIAYFETQKKQLQAENDKQKKEAEKLSKKLEGTKIPLIRQASASGQLFGSVAARDIASELAKISGEKIDKSMVYINQNFKLVGLFPVDIYLHPEVKVEVILNIARSNEEAEIQAETGKALIDQESKNTEELKSNLAEDDSDQQLENVLEEGALASEKEKIAQEKADAAADEAKAQAAKEAKEQAKQEAESSAAEEASETDEAKED